MHPVCPGAAQALCRSGECACTEVLALFLFYARFIMFTSFPNSPLPSPRVPAVSQEVISAKKENRTPLRFMVVGEDLETGDLVRDFANLGEEEPLFAILDIPKQLKYTGDDLALSCENVERLVTEYKEGRTPWRPLDA